MEKRFELEIWPNAQKMKLVYATMIVITILSWISHVIGTIYWEGNTYWVTNLRGISYEAGWPVILYWWGLYLGIGSPLGMILVYSLVDRKNPSLAVSKDGLFVNQQMIKQAHVAWSDISKIHKSVNGDDVKLEIYFKDAQKIIDGQSGMKKAFLKENLKDGKPLTVENKFTIGDLAALADKANGYLSQN